MRRTLNTRAIWMLSLAALVAVALVRAGTESETDPVARLAVERYEKIQETLWSAANERASEEVRRELARNDPARTGLIGPEWSDLVTTSGSLEAKQASASPGWVLVYRRWFQELNLRPGDRVAISSSASFPALFLASMVAAESLGLECDAVISLTASNHGATIEAFDFFAMYRTLVERELLVPCVRGVTPGGAGDAARDLEPDARARLLARLDAIASERPGTETVVPGTLEESLAFRSRLLLDTDRPAAYINIGGHATGYGTGARVLAMPNGLIRPGALRTASLPDSVLGEALARDIPAINAIDIMGLAASEGFSPGDGVLLAPLSPVLRGVAAIAVAALLSLLWTLGRPIRLIPTQEELAL